MSPAPTKFKYCSKGHTSLFHLGQKCPMCLQVAATSIITREYLKVSGMVNQLLVKLHRAKAN
jgi:hypothetical protein